MIGGRTESDSDGLWRGVNLGEKEAMILED